MIQPVLLIINTSREPIIPSEFHRIRNTPPPLTDHLSCFSASALVSPVSRAKVVKKTQFK